MMIDTGTIAAQWAEYVTQLRVEEIPEEVRQWAKVLVMDNLACILGGVQTEAGQATLSAAAQMGVLAGGPCTVPGAGGRKAAAPWAACVGGTLANALDYDDTLYGHPGSAVIPVALAVSEAVGASGEEFLVSLVMGYEIAARLCAATAPSAGQRKLVWGIANRLAPVAAAITARLLRLPAALTAQAIAHAAANAPVSSINKTLYSDLGPTMVKNNYGMALIAGVSSAYLAQAGHTAPLDVFEGPTGWWRMIGSDSWRPAEATAELGSRYDILRVELKPYPCCRFIHSAIGATMDLCTSHRVSASDVRAVEVKTFSWVSGGAFAERRPDSMASAQFSIPYCIAVTLLGHPPGPAWFDKSVMESQAVAQIADKVRLTPCPEFDDRHVEEWLAHVSIDTSRGRFDQLMRFPLGHPKNPMRSTAAEEKFETLAAGALGHQRAAVLRDLIQGIEAQESVGEVAALLGDRQSATLAQAIAA